MSTNSVVDVSANTIADGEKHFIASQPKHSVTPEYFSGIKLVLTMIALLLSMFLVALDMSIIATAIPSITAEFHSLSDVGWYGSAFFMTLAAFQSFWGKAFKHFNLKLVVLISVFVFEIGSLICAVSQNSTTFIAGRAIQGVGGAGVTNGVYVILAFTVAPARLPSFIGILGMTFALASVAGPLLGGVLTDKITWRWCFYINLPVGGASAAIIFFVFHTPAHAHNAPLAWKKAILAFDIPGVALLLCSFVCLFLALQWGGVEKAWNTADVVGALVGWITLAILFVIVQWRQQENALLVPRILKKRIIWSCCAFIFCLNAASFARTYNLPVYFQAIDGVSPTQSGIRTLPTVLALAIFSFLGSFLVGKTGRPLPFFILGSMLATVGSGIIYTLDVGSGANEYIGFQICAGIGVGLVVQLPLIVVHSTQPPADISMVTATVLFFQTLGGAVGVSSAGSIFNNRVIAYVRIFAPDVIPAQVIAAGENGIREAFPAGQVQGIVLAYMAALKDAWVFSIALAGISSIACLGIGWISIKPKQAVKKVGEEVEKEGGEV